MKTKTVYVATDGREFARYCAALNHQQDLAGDRLDDLFGLLGLRGFDGVSPKQMLIAHGKLTADPAVAVQVLRRLTHAVHALIGGDEEAKEETESQEDLP